MREHPEIVERTAAMLAGKLPVGAEMEPERDALGRRKRPRTLTERPVNLRLPPTVLARADALAPHVAVEFGTIRSVTRSAVLRLAIEQGLASLEKRYKA